MMTGIDLPISITFCAFPQPKSPMKRQRIANDDGVEQSSVRGDLSDEKIHITWLL